MGKVEPLGRAGKLFLHAGALWQDPARARTGEMQAPFKQGLQAGGGTGGDDVKFAAGQCLHADIGDGYVAGGVRFVGDGVQKAAFLGDGFDERDVGFGI